MKIHKFKAKTESEAIGLVKQELGSKALIVSVKRIKPKGFFSLFKKPFVEVTAALDETVGQPEEGLPSINLKATDVIKNKELIEEKTVLAGEEVNQFKQFIKNYSSKQNHKQEVSKQIISGFSDKLEKTSAPAIRTIKEEDNDKLEVIKVIYEQLLDNEVEEIYANQITENLAQGVLNEEVELDEIVSIIYGRIIKELSDYKVISQENQVQKVFFVGPTGVGKTTTIAKIASIQTLVYNKKVALITADTYRIAAVEQLRTYANILGIPLKVIYSEQEIIEAVKGFADKDLILIDTAGRSHKHIEHQQELKRLLDQIEDKEVYLTLSVATKYKDLIKITAAYNQICEYHIIFTKLDETISLGNILNVKMATQAKLSYITFGQNVPDDISELDPHRVAKNILGGEDDGSGQSA